MLPRIAATAAAAILLAALPLAVAGGAMPGWTAYLVTIAASVRLAVATAILAPVAGAALAWALRRGRPSPRLVMLPFAIAAAALLELAVAGRGIGALISATLLALPFTTMIALVALGRVGAAQRRAAASLGATPSALLHRVVLPGVAPGLGCAACAGFVVGFGDRAAAAGAIAPGVAAAALGLVLVAIWPRNWSV